MSTNYIYNKKYMVKIYTQHFISVMLKTVKYRMIEEKEKLRGSRKKTREEKVEKMNRIKRERKKKVIKNKKG